MFTKMRNLAFILSTFTCLAQGSEASQSQEIQYKRQKERVRRWSIGPYAGVTSVLGKIDGYEMHEAFSTGFRASYNFNPYFGVGLQVSVDLLHFSEDKGSDPGSLDITSLNHTAFAQFTTSNGFFIAPTAGVSQKTFNHREQGGLSHRDKKGGDDLLILGGVIGWNFKISPLFSMGPKVEFFRLISKEENYVDSHSTLSAYFNTQFTF